jgi:hypothetical protein
MKEFPADKKIHNLVNKLRTMGLLTGKKKISAEFLLKS